MQWTRTLWSPLAIVSSATKTHSKLFDEAGLPGLLKPMWTKIEAAAKEHKATYELVALLVVGW